MKNGDLVRLISGGFNMTVRNSAGLGVPTNYDKPVLCEWHDAQGLPHSEWYEQDQLLTSAEFT